MTYFQLAGLLLCIVVVLGYINNRYLKFPDTIGVTTAGLLLSVALLALGKIYPEVASRAVTLAAGIDFYEVVFHGLLGFLLFAGALHANVQRLWAQIVPVSILATVSVGISTFVVGYGLFHGLDLAGIRIDLVYCLMFGALISPTDPIAVMSILKKHALPESLQTKIAGESLFNDGTGVVAFLTLAGIASAMSAGDTAALPTVQGVALLLATEIGGGLLFGASVGALGLLALRKLTGHQLEIMVTLAMATAGYAAAEFIHVSAPIAVVIMGLMIGNLGPKHAFSEGTEEHLFNFWELTDELLNLLLFSLIGIMMLALDMTADHLLVIAIAIPVALAGRLVSVLLPSLALKPFLVKTPHSIKIMTWGGLRGGISIALALSMPPFADKGYLIAATYGVVLFSLLVQALTLGRLLQYVKRDIGDGADLPATDPAGTGWALRTAQRRSAQGTS